MKYEIITDKDDLHVLVVNSIVLEVSRDMSSIMHTMWDIYRKRQLKMKRDYVPATINLETTPKEDIATENYTSGSLGRLFDL